MVLKCVRNTYKKGLIVKTLKTVDLTVGKEYDAQAVPLVSHSTGYTFLSDIKFLVFDDSGVWQVYPKSFFVPK